MKKYTENCIKDMVKKRLAKNPHSFYTDKILNYSGSTSDTKRRYTEVIAEALLDEYKYVAKIGNDLPIRIKSFNEYHNGFSDVKARLNRFGELKYSEKLFAIALYNSKKSYCFGKIFDYEIPLKEVNGDEYGKIDLVAKHEVDNTIKLLELKINNVSGPQETLLRALLEIYSYYKLISNSFDKFIKDYSLSNKKYICFQPGILADQDAVSGKIIDRINEYPNTKKLILRMSDEININIELFVFDYPNRGKPFKCIEEIEQKKKIGLDGNVAIRKIHL